MSLHLLLRPGLSLFCALALLAPGLRAEDEPAADERLLREHGVTPDGLLGFFHKRTPAAACPSAAC